MKRFHKYKAEVLYLLIVFLAPVVLRAQQSVVINMAPIDGLPITPDNIFNYQVQSSGPANVQVKGRIRYKNSDLNLSYSFNCALHQGLNYFSADLVHPQWQFSASALQELFFNYRVLPAGTFEYCVTITPTTVVKEGAGSVFDECLYHRAGDFFLINLVDPEDKAKLREFNPVLSWVANYSFANELVYRIRVAEIKQAQTPINAVLRNQPVLDEKNLMQNSIIYPVYAKPLEANKPYAWTVDAYYKGILLGGSESWQFIIPNDTLPAKVPATRSYIDVKRENGANKLFAVGTLKLKYVLEDAASDSLYLSLYGEKNSEISFAPNKLAARYGDNRYDIDLDKSTDLKHKAHYKLHVKTKTGHEYTLPFQYLNPDYIR